MTMWTTISWTKEDIQYPIPQENVCYPIDSPLFEEEDDAYILKNLYKAHIQDSTFYICDWYEHLRL